MTAVASMRLPKMFVGQRRRLFIWLVLNGLGQGLLAVLSAWMVKAVFDSVGSAAPTPMLVFLALGAAVIVVALLRRIERVHAELLGQYYVRAVRSRLFSRLLDTDLRQFRQHRKGGVLMKFVGDLSALRRWVSLGLARLLVASAAVMIGLIALYLLHWSFAVGVSAVLAGTTAWILWFSPRLRTLISEARRCHASLSANVSEKLAGLATVQAFDERRRERRRLRVQSDRLITASVRRAGSVGTLRAVIDAAAGGSVAVLIGIASLLPVNELNAGMLAAAISIVGFLTPPLRDVGRAQEYWLASQVAKQHLAAVARRSVRIPRPRDADALVITEGSVRFESVRVDNVLETLNAAVTPRAKVALMGANGSGKSTLLGLVGRLFDADAGRVLIDGQDTAKVELSSLRRQVAYVSADIPLIRGSLKKNITYGAGDVDTGELDRILSACDLIELVARVPGGLDARIAEGGTNLSQGERVRVSLARALLSSPKILLLDEADANLDLRAIRALNRVLECFDGTVIMATHRRTSWALCDTFWQLTDGVLKELPKPTRLDGDGDDAPCSSKVDVNIGHCEVRK